MHVYRVTSPAHEPKIIFANSLDDAAQMICGWHALNEIEPTEFAIDFRWLRRLPKQEAAILQEVLKWKVDGIGTQRADGQWCILPPRDEREDS